MLAVLENPEIRQRATPVSVEMYHHLFESGLIDEKNELLDGLIVKKMPKSPLHEFLVETLAQIARETAAPGLYVRKEALLTLAPLHSEPEPDVAVVTRQARDFFKRHPTSAHLAMEVSVTTEGTDRTKTLIYARAGVPEYWIVLAERAEVKILRVPSADGYAEHRLFRHGETVESTELPGLRIAMDELFPAD